MFPKSNPRVKLLNFDLLCVFLAGGHGSPSVEITLPINLRSNERRTTVRNQNLKHDHSIRAPSRIHFDSSIISGSRSIRVNEPENETRDCRTMSRGTRSEPSKQSSRTHDRVFVFATAKCVLIWRALNASVKEGFATRFASLVSLLQRHEQQGTRVDILSS